MFGSFPPSPLVVCASKVYSGLGADIVIESFHSLTRIWRTKGAKLREGLLTTVIRKGAQFDAGAQIAATVHPTSSATQLLPSALKRTSNVYCFVRTPSTAVPGAVL